MSPGVQVDGYFRDSPRTNGNNGWNHDSQFVIRLPDKWNGGLVVSGAPPATDSDVYEQAGRQGR